MNSQHISGEVSLFNMHHMGLLHRAGAPLGAPIRKEHIAGLLVKSAAVNSGSKALCVQRIIRRCCLRSEGYASSQTCPCPPTYRFLLKLGTGWLNKSKSFLQFHIAVPA